MNLRFLHVWQMRALAVFWVCTVRTLRGEQRPPERIYFPMRDKLAVLDGFWDCVARTPGGCLVLPSEFISLARQIGCVG